MVEHIQKLHVIKYPPPPQPQAVVPLPSPRYYNPEDMVREAYQVLDRWGILPHVWFGQPYQWRLDMLEVVNTYHAIPERLDATGWFTNSGDIRKPKSEDQKILDGLRDRYGH